MSANKGEILENTGIDKRFQLIEVLGRGGIAIVYRARQTDNDHDVAIKVLNKDWLDSPIMRERFHHEARTLSVLSHPNIVKILDYETSNQRPYIILELIDGIILSELLKKGPLPPKIASDIFRQILQALEYAHKNGIAHRDIKPENIFLQQLPDSSNNVKIYDFGFAHFIEEIHKEEKNKEIEMEFILGTPSYLAPEQIMGNPGDHRIDIYASAIILYMMLSGRKPFEGSLEETLKQKLSLSFPSLQESCPQLSVSDEFEHFIRVALSKNPEDRPKNAGEMLKCYDKLDPLSSAIPSGKDYGGILIVSIISFVSLLVLGLYILVAQPTKEQDSHDSISAYTENFDQTIMETKEDKSLNFLPNVPNPWLKSDSMPKVLSDTYLHLESRQIVGDKAVFNVVRYANKNSNDFRPYLLLGHIYTNRNWYSGALRQYFEAHRINSDARGDPRMLVNLIAMSIYPKTNGRATSMIRRIYGKEAKRVVELALHSTHLNKTKTRRLQRLLDKL